MLMKFVQKKMKFVHRIRPLITKDTKDYAVISGTKDTNIL